VLGQVKTEREVEVVRDIGRGVRVVERALDQRSSPPKAVERLVGFAHHRWLRQPDALT